MSNFTAGQDQQQQSPAAGGVDSPVQSKRSPGGTAKKSKKKKQIFELLDSNEEVLEVLIKVLTIGENRSFDDFIDSINKMAYTQPIKSKSKTSEVAVIRKGDFVEICQEWA